VQFANSLASASGWWSVNPELTGATVWLVQQCEAGTRIPLLGKPDSAPRMQA